MAVCPDLHRSIDARGPLGLGLYTVYNWVSSFCVVCALHWDH